MMKISADLYFSPIEILLQIIVNRYFSSSYCLAFVSEVNTNFRIPYTYTYINTDGKSVDALINQMFRDAEMGCSDYIVQIKEPRVFMEAFERVTRLANARRSNKKIVFLPYNNDEYNVNDLLSVIKMKETSFVANLLLVVPARSNAADCVFYDLVSHKFVGSDSECNEPLYLDRWNSCTQEKFEKGANLFPHEDLSNLYGKTMKVACFTYKPYVLLDLDTSVVPFGRDGTEIQLVEEFCRWINCTIDLVREDEGQWGEIYENGTGIGVLGGVAEDRADLGITALYSWYESYLHLDLSCPSIRTAITCIAPAPRLLISWDMPLDPFDLNMWIGVVLTFIVTGSVLALALGTFDKVFLIAFGILTAQSHNDSVVSWRRRRVTGWIIVSSVIICNAYSAGLASTFTVPKFEKSIDTIQDILDTKSIWGATHDAWVFSLSLSKEPRIIKLVEQFRIYNSDELKRKSFTRSILFSIEKLPSGSYAIGEYITEEAVRDFMLMQEDFYYEQNVVNLRKSSPYTSKMNDLIGRLHESGLLLEWETQVALKHLNYKVQQEVRLSRSKKEVDIVPLSFRHIVGIFYMYILGIAISAVLFIIELFSKRDKTKIISENSVERVFA